MYSDMGDAGGDNAPVDRLQRCAGDEVSIAAIGDDVLVDPCAMSKSGLELRLAPGN
jgi:hypothetical protein